MGRVCSAWASRLQDERPQRRRPLGPPTQIPLAADAKIPAESLPDGAAIKVIASEAKHGLNLLISIGLAKTL